VWSDEFDAEAGTPPDAENWNHDVGTDWGNRQLEFDTDRVDNAHHDGAGSLIIRALEENYEGRAYTSARLNTRHLFSARYGRFEARIRMPEGKGIWPAFWLLGANFEEQIWPNCGEIDVFELRGSDPTTVHGSLHGPGYSASGALSRAFELASGSFTDDFHLFAIEWSPDSISWFVDGTVYQTRRTDDRSFYHGGWVFDHDFFMILNVAVGGHYDGSPSENTVFPQEMLVDYVRVWKQ
jgi:beta-glucanase (GH16 family)